MKRNYGLDALKIISMFMIVVLHVLGQGGILSGLPQFTARYNIAWFIEIMCLCSVNCFALITGYLHVDKKYNYRSLISLWLQVLFYSVLLTFFAKFFYPETINYTYITKMFLPTMAHSYWYFTAYVGLFFFIPLLNLVLEHGNRKTVSRSILLVTLFISIGGMFNSNFMWENSGYSTIWLMVMYLIGGYIKKYNKTSKSPLGNLCVFAWFCLIGYIIKMVVDLYFPNVLYVNRLSYSMLSYTSPFLVIASVNLFMFFKSYSPKYTITKKTIKFFAPISFGVYLVHTNPAIWENFMKNRFVFCLDKLSFSFMLYLLASCVILFLICAFVDYGRMKIFEKIKVNRLSEKIVTKIESILS